MADRPAQPGPARPGAVQPGQIQPGAAQPGQAQPAAGAAAPRRAARSRQAASRGGKAASRSWQAAARRGERGGGVRGSLVAYVIVLLGAAAGLGWVFHRGTHGVRQGTLALAGAVLVGALARLVLPESRAGMLASRSRITDVVTLAALAGGLLAVGFML